MDLGRLFSDILAPVLQAFSDFIAKIGEILKPVEGFFLDLFKIQ